MTDAKIIEIVLGLCIGAGAGWFFTHRALSRRFDLKLRRIVELHRKQHEVVVDKLNAAHALVRKGLDRPRSAPPRHLAVAAADQRSAVLRLEEKLKSAYAELDRLRLKVNGPAPVGTPTPLSGFADTQPFHAHKKALQR